jgi:hypothetical protein
MYPTIVVPLEESARAKRVLLGSVVTPDLKRASVQLVLVRPAGLRAGTSALPHLPDCL